MQYEIIDKAIGAGIAKTSRALTRTVMLSVMAGAFIALGGVLSVYLGSGVGGLSVDSPAVGKLLSGLAFPVGLFLIVMFGGELFTGNNAVLMPALRQGNYGWRAVASNWTTVWTGNFIGALVFTYLLVYGTGLIDSEPYNSAVRNIAEAKTSLGSMKIFLRGIGANWCVCLAVWLTLGARSIVEKMIVVWIPVSAFVILGFEHCIANMFFIPAGIMAGADIPVAEFARNLLFSTIGNIVGGALLVGMLYTRLYHRKDSVSASRNRE